MKDEMVWLNRQQLAKLFDRDIKTIGKHINNALNEELKDIPTVAKFATVQKNRIDDRLEENDAKEILKVIGNYSKALDLLDDYDHRTLKKIKGT